MSDFTKVELDWLIYGMERAIKTFESNIDDDGVNGYHNVGFWRSRIRESNDLIKKLRVMYDNATT